MVSEKQIPQIFGKDWFSKYQKVLLRFVNTKVGRYVFCINGKRSSVGKKKIVEFAPNFITWNSEKKGLLTTEFRVNNKYSNRLFNAFYPVWYLFHIWDTLFANNFRPAWNLGFDDLTVYPAAGANEPFDGYATRGAVDETFATIRGEAGQSSDSSTGEPLSIFMNCSTTNNQFQYLVRSLVLFDTSGLGSGAIISSAVFGYTASAKTNGMGDVSVVIVSSTPGSTSAVANADYSQLGSTSFGSTAYASINTDNSTYNNITLTEAGESNISLTGISKFGIRNHWDQSNSAPSWGSGNSSSVSIRSADATGTANDPKLVITYTVGTNYFKTFNETITVTDSLQKAITKTLSETITVTDSMAKAITKIFSETVTLSEIFSKVHGHYKTFSEAAITISDTIKKATTKTFSETVNITDTMLRTITKTFTESISITDTIEKLLNKAYAFPSYIKSAVVEKATGFISSKDKPKAGKASSVDKPEGV